MAVVAGWPLYQRASYIYGYTEVAAIAKWPVGLGDRCLRLITGLSDFNPVV